MAKKTIKRESLNAQIPADTMKKLRDHCEQDGKVQWRVIDAALRGWLGAEVSK